jgi:hypothetical protein
MSNPVKIRKHDTRVDAWAILFMVILIFAAAIFWVTRH